MGDISAHLDSSEVRCHCGCGEGYAVPELVMLFEYVREQLGNNPLRISNVYRCKKHNAEVGGADNSYHTKGMAMDIQTSVGIALSTFQSRMQLAVRSFRGLHGYGRIGFYRWGVHIDTASTEPYTFIGQRPEIIKGMA